MLGDYEDRKRLTFEQAEGAGPLLPSQLALKEISRELRIRLWEKLHSSFNSDNHSNWDEILRRKHVYRDLRPHDEFPMIRLSVRSEVKQLIINENYLQVFGLLQWMLRQPEIPQRLHEDIEDALRQSRAAYAVFDRDTIIPVGSDAERETLARAFADVAASEFHGARAHLRNAGSELTAGEYGPSIRESIHAVEAVARVLEPGAQTLRPALLKLEKSVRIHPALGKGFGSLYGFTSDKKGIRHALLDEPVAQVDEADALYMLGSCAAFVSYLINKVRQVGLLGQATP
jgi:hypothetical protein